MKKLLAILFLAVSAQAATSTTNMGLIKPEDGEINWGSPIRANYDIIDSSVAILNSTQTFTGGVTITSGTVEGLRSNQLFISTASYGGSEKLAVNGDAKFFGPLGANVSFCDAAGINCQAATLNTSNPSSGLNISTITMTGRLTSAGISATSGTITTSYGNTVNLAGNNAGIGIATGNGSSAVINMNNSSLAATLDTQTAAINITDNTNARSVLSYSSSSNLVRLGYGPSANTSTVGLSSTSFNGYAQLQSKTAAQIRALTPAAVGQYYFCSDCTTVSACVSTGTAVFQWALITNKGSACN